MNRLVFLILLTPAVYAGNELPYEFWERQYRHCIDTADVVVVGQFKSHQLLETAGYNHYKVAIDVLYPVKNFSAERLYFTSWYEDHSVQNRKGKALFCLCKGTSGNLIDPSGNNVYPIDNRLLKYAKDYKPKQTDEKWTPLCKHQ